MEKNVNEELNDMELGEVSGGVQNGIPISMKCDKCGYWFSVSERYGGTEGKCPECKEGTLRRRVMPID